MKNGAKILQKAIYKQSIEDFNKLKWELNEKLADIDPETLSKPDVSILNNLFTQIINKLKQQEPT